MIEHSHYIKSMADKSGKTYRELDTLWKKAQREFEFDQMMNPSKYQSLKKVDGSVAEEIGRRFEKLVSGNEEQTTEVNDMNAIEPTIPMEPVVDVPLVEPAPELMLPAIPTEEKTPEEIAGELEVGGTELNEFPNT